MGRSVVRGALCLERPPVGPPSGRWSLPQATRIRRRSSLHVRVEPRGRELTLEDREACLDADSKRLPVPVSLRPRTRIYSLLSAGIAKKSADCGDVPAGEAELRPGLTEREGDHAYAEKGPRGGFGNAVQASGTTTTAATSL
jgi:hypothetical protein